MCARIPATALPEELLDIAHLMVRLRARGIRYKGCRPPLGIWPTPPRPPCAGRRRRPGLLAATALRDRARHSTYSGKAADARGHVVRTLIVQFERLTASIDDLDETLQNLLRSFFDATPLFSSH